MQEMMNKDVADSILELANQIKKASIFRGTTEKPFEVQSVTIDLSTARLATDAYPIGFPFKSVYVSGATDVLANINMLPNTTDSFQSAVPLKQNDSWTIEQPVSKAFLYWTAQAGKTMTLHFFVESEFRSGSQISVTGGGVAIIEGTSFTQSALTLVAATALAVFASDSTRKVGVFQNLTGNSVWLGGSTVSNTSAFFELQPGAVFEWRNTAALYAYSVLGGSSHKTEEF